MLDDGAVLLPDGSPLTARLFQQLGYVLGASGGEEALHYLLERDPKSPAFAYDVASSLPFSARNPLYSVIHESSYSDGFATRWSAERVLPDEFELYDLVADPHELTNVADDPGYAAVRADLEAELARRQADVGDEPYRGPDTPRLDWSV